MRKAPTVFAALGLFGCLLLPSFAAQTRVNISMRPGLWEMTRDPTSVNLAPELLERMKPQQRDAAEAQLKDNLAGLQPHRRFICVSHPSIERRFDGHDFSTSECEFSVSFLASTYADGHMECRNSSLRGSGTFRIEVLGPTNVYLTSEFALTRTDGAKVANARGVERGRWAADSCSQTN